MYKFLKNIFKYLIHFSYGRLSSVKLELVLCSVVIEQYDKKIKVFNKDFISNLPKKWSCIQILVIKLTMSF